MEVQPGSTGYQGQFGVAGGPGICCDAGGSPAIKNVPGRKTDGWTASELPQLHTYGLLSAAFRPLG